MSKTFADFSLAEPLQLALNDLGFTAPTPVQEQSIPAAMEGKDLLVSSQTGSGKTVAFLLPTLNALAEQNVFVPFKERMRAVPTPSILVLCPTRELAQQVSHDAIDLVRHMKGVRIAAVMGGMPFGKQIQQLKGAQVLVATPGRLLDLVNRRQLKLDKVHALIVDEADRMLDLGFAEDLAAISDLAGEREQTLMFSATFADRIISLAERMMNSPERIAIETGHTTNTDVTQTLHWTDGFEHKKKLLSHWLSDEKLDQAVVFASTQEDTDMLAEELAEAGHSVVALHGAMPQSVRNRRLRSIREGKARILVATDVAARGLDVPTISHVINFGLPMKHEDYVHRVGRTGRAGRSGQAVTLATYRERGKIRALEDYLETRLNVSEIEGLEPSPPPERPRRNGNGNGKGRGGERRGGGRGFDRSDRGERRSFGDDKRGFGGRRRLEGEGHFKNEDRQPRRDRNDFSANTAGDAGSRFGAKSFDKPRGERQDRPRFEDDNRGNRVDYKPREERKSYGDRGERRSFGDKPRGFGGGERSEFSRPKRQFNDDKPRSFRDRDGSDRPARREFDGEQRPRRQDGGEQFGERRFGRHDNTERRFSQGDRGERRYNREGGERQPREGGERRRKWSNDA
ncbi:DEAD/DEAH box helicase [Acinetobacter qingfengensis]|uniref:DEAD/DEAH box helicase n=1 Tax=Acinetobacter qingfengensis TaxID=1262585 RepID=A0A1E7R196_9GAMM|nr:DEAD/DEAH box helicase [Acinetobacter qingfengensis]KAA8733286.1 DEAD/DEAH box helicase [Acinetobacter qingfengensis]OEY93083.1 DEAD/DEAH box helicase [Acinetobacter qingfengensis]